MVPAHSRLASSTYRSLSKFVSLIFLLVLIPSAFGGAPAQAQGAVNLLYFEATPFMDNHILIEWETTNELNVVAFQVQRSLQEDGGFVQIGGLQPAKGDGVTGATYSLIDNEVTPGRIYYRLRMLRNEN
ncbi:MAG TPA: hypothetical protein VL334_06190 [Anaerolineae bacterium]|nr:hypothetical protein [Anaerolineae bacterium]